MGCLEKELYVPDDMADLNSMVESHPWPILVSPKPGFSERRLDNLMLSREGAMIVESNHYRAFTAVLAGRWMWLNDDGLCKKAYVSSRQISP